MSPGSACILQAVDSLRPQLVVWRVSLETSRGSIQDIHRPCASLGLDCFTGIAGSQVVEAIPVEITCSQTPAKLLVAVLNALDARAVLIPELIVGGVGLQASGRPVQQVDRACIHALCRDAASKISVPVAVEVTDYQRLTKGIVGAGISLYPRAILTPELVVRITACRVRLKTTCGSVEQGDRPSTINAHKLPKYVNCEVVRSVAVEVTRRQCPPEVITGLSCVLYPGLSATRTGHRENSLEPLLDPYRTLAAPVRSRVSG